MSHAQQDVITKGGIYGIEEKINKANQLWLLVAVDLWRVWADSAMELQLFALKKKHVQNQIQQQQWSSEIWTETAFFSMDAIEEKEPPVHSKEEEAFSCKIVRFLGIM